MELHHTLGFFKGSIKGGLPGSISFTSTLSQMEPDRSRKSDRERRVEVGSEKNKVRKEKAPRQRIAGAIGEEKTTVEKTRKRSR